MAALIKLLWALLLAVSLFGCSRAVSRPQGVIEESRFPSHIDGIFNKAEYIDLNADNTDKLYIRYGPLSDSGVELERSANDVVLWRVYVQPLGVAHSKYYHEVRVQLWGDQICVTSTGAKQIVEVRSLTNGAFVSRRVTDVAQQRYD